MGYKGCSVCFKTMRDDGTPCPHCARTPEQQAAHNAKARWYCTTCGAQTNRPVWVVNGSFATEVLLWLLMVLPGVLYSVWRITTKTQCCKQCRKATLIPIDSPVARAAIDRLR